MGLAFRVLWSCTFSRLTFQLHADLETLLKPAVGTPLPLRFVNHTRTVCHTVVDLLVLDGPLEEALAGLARQEAVVVAAHFVAAHRAQVLHVILGVGLVGLADEAAAPGPRPVGAPVPVARGELVHHAVVGCVVVGCRQGCRAWKIRGRRPRVNEVSQKLNKYSLLSRYFNEVNEFRAARRKMQHEGKWVRKRIK